MEGDGVGLTARDGKVVGEKEGSKRSDAGYLSESRSNEALECRMSRLSRNF